MAPFKTRETIEAAAAVLREGKLPPKHEAAAIVKGLDAIALALMLGEVHARRNAGPIEGAIITIQSLGV